MLTNYDVFLAYNFVQLFYIAIKGRVNKSGVQIP